MLAAGWLGYACNRAFFEGNNFSSTKATSKSKGTFTMEQNAFSAWLSGQRSRSKARVVAPGIGFGKGKDFLCYIVGVGHCTMLKNFRILKIFLFFGDNHHQ